MSHSGKSHFENAMALFSWHCFVSDSRSICREDRFPTVRTDTCRTASLSMGDDHGPSSPLAPASFAQRRHASFRPRNRVVPGCAGGEWGGMRGRSRGGTAPDQPRWGRTPRSAGAPGARRHGGLVQQAIGRRDRERGGPVQRRTIHRRPASNPTA